MRLYVCLGPLKKAFTQFCRHLVRLDGCHLKGPYGGHLLAALGVDANDGMYPIAWAVVESETTKSWTWFLELLTHDLKIQVDAERTFISDRQKGLINALEAIVPNAEHRFCVMHLYQNMHKEFKGKTLRQLLWKAARASTDWEFNLHMNRMKEIAPKCHDWLIAKPKTQWTRAAFRINVHSDMCVNNHCEVFNSSIRKYRDLPIITMFRELHKSVMKRIQVRRDKLAARDTVICPSALNKLDKSIQYAGNCVVSWSGGTTCLVTCTDAGHELVVDLEKKSCTCRKWNLTGIPCYHACACIAIRNDPWENHIHECYSKDMYMKLYSCLLEPIVSPEFWEQASARLGQLLIVPTKNDAIKKAAEQGTVPNIAKTTCVCKICNQPGHNSRTCAQKKQQQHQNTIPEMMHQHENNRQADLILVTIFMALDLLVEDIGVQF
ncbi:uncharacterized protein LOC141685879 [Apium graveolens]|uniref:uncharacterized protein LOC141685879 n=1 Tax=Apium graveolens TaxID=4045 RepID=UPI003D7B857A